MCKREFQKLLRKVARKQKFDFFRKLDVHASNSEKLFRLLRNYTNTHPDPTDKLTFEGNEYQGDNIDNGWADFFESLGTASAASYSDPTPHHLNTDTLHDMDNSLLADFVTSEVEEAINYLASNKASGPDNIMPEHLKYGGATLIFHLTQLFNLLVEYKYVPQSLKHGNIIPIPKSKDKDPTDPSNYRGITLLPTICKLWEKIILTRFRAHGITSKIHPLQGGFRPGYSCLHTAFLFQETITHLRERKKVYVALLDVKKAFDTVWHAGLFFKLQQAEITGQALHFLRQWYEHSTCSVLWNGKPSRTIHINQGVKQGGVLSPFLYNLYVNDLLVDLENSGLGARVGDIFTGAPMYADDLALIASSPEELQGMLDIVQTYAQKWRYSLHPGKSKVMVFGSRQPSPLRWKLGSDTIEVVEQHLHLGILHSTKSTIARTILQTSRGCSSFFALNRFGTKFGCTHPLTALRLYQAFSLPRMLYGASLWNISKTEIEFFFCTNHPEHSSLGTSYWESLYCPQDLKTSS